LPMPADIVDKLIRMSTHYICQEFSYGGWVSIQKRHILQNRERITGLHQSRNLKMQDFGLGYAV
jgi:hypothetical protein